MTTPTNGLPLNGLDKLRCIALDPVFHTERGRHVYDLRHDVDSYLASRRLAREAPT